MKYFFTFDNETVDSMTYNDCCMKLVVYNQRKRDRKLF